MGVSSALRLMRVAALAAAAVNGLPAGSGGGGPGTWSAAGEAAARRVLVQENGSGLSTGVTVVYIIVSVILVAVSGLMVRAGAPARPCAMPLQMPPLPPAPREMPLPRDRFAPNCICRPAWCWACCRWTSERG